MHKSWNSMNQLPGVPLVVAVLESREESRTRPALGVGVGGALGTLGCRDLSGRVVS